MPNPEKFSVLFDRLLNNKDYDQMVDLIVSRAREFELVEKGGERCYTARDYDVEIELSIDEETASLFYNGNYWMFSVTEGKLFCWTDDLDISENS